MNMEPQFYPRGYFPPVSNTERQRAFRERNPGYYGRLHRRKKQARLARLKVQALEAEQQRAMALQAALTKPYQLCLPATVEPIELPTRESIQALKDALAFAQLKAA